MRQYTHDNFFLIRYLLIQFITI